VTKTPEKELAWKRDRYHSDPEYRLARINAARKRYGSPPLASLDAASIHTPLRKPQVSRYDPDDHLAERFWKRVDRKGADECWPWTGPVSQRGYGMITLRSKPVRATHIAMKLDGRDRPDGLHALHTCDNPVCVNPSHLWWGTHVENMHDMIAKGRSRLKGVK
jgi:hypothetical protein